MKISWKNYLIELIIVIIGITIAFWLNGVGEGNKQRKQKENYLIDIKHDLRKDSLKLTYNLIHNREKVEKLSRALQLIQEKSPEDSVRVYIAEIGNYDFFIPDNFTLTSLLQSGDLKLIESKNTKKELMRLLNYYESINTMQSNFLQALDENYFPMLLSNVDMMEFKAVDSSFFYSLEIKNYCAFTLSETKIHIGMYARTKDQVNAVIELIENELNE